jgi:pimeloyl-ACP methyl ester carboxylesterase
MLPLAVSEAVKGDFRPITTLFLLTSESVQEMLAIGMHNTVVCSEDVPRFGSMAMDRAAMAATYLGTGFVDVLPTLCKNWPRGPVDAELFTPLVSSVPTLLLSGTLDPVTPPFDAERVARTLRNSRHVALTGAGHGQLGVPCMDRVVADFFASPDVQALDTRCLDRRIQPPFWVSIAGPAP